MKTYSFMAQLQSHQLGGGSLSLSNWQKQNLGLRRVRLLPLWRSGQRCRKVRKQNCLEKTTFVVDMGKESPACC